MSFFRSNCLLFLACFFVYVPNASSSNLCSVIFSKGLQVLKTGNLSNYWQTKSRLTEPLSSKDKMIIASRSLEKAPMDQMSKENFLSSASEIYKAGHTEGKKSITDAYEMVLDGLRHKKFSEDHLLLLVSVIKKEDSVARNFPKLSYPLNDQMQEFLSDKIAGALIKDPHFSVKDALEIITWLESNGIFFSKEPFHKKFLVRQFESILFKEGHSKKWALGEVFRAARKAGKNTDLVEVAIMRSFHIDFESMRDKLFFVAEIKKHQRKYDITNEFVVRLFDAWMKVVSDKPVSHYLDPENNLIRLRTDISILHKYSKAVMTVKEFLDQYGLQPHDGYLFGVGTDFYQSFSELTGLTDFLKGYHQFFMSIKMSKLSDIEKTEKTEKYVRHVLKTGKKVVFVIPPDINKTFFSKIEWDYLMEKPEERLKNVIFLVGSSGDKR